MQIYANLFKINEKCRLSAIQKSQQIYILGMDVYYASRNLLFTCIYFKTMAQVHGMTDHFEKLETKERKRIKFHQIGK